MFQVEGEENERGSVEQNAERVFKRRGRGSIFTRHGGFDVFSPRNGGRAPLYLRYI